MNVPDGADPNRLYPLHDKLQLFKLSGPPGRTTAACGLGIYRDELLGPEYQGNAFVCEPVNLLVHRRVLSPKGSTFTGKRAAGEEDAEFLASTDPWFRPVQVRTGPDGALWVVDMYRYVIEHPRWIPPEELAKVDVRAGSTMGRIYRIYPPDQPPRAWSRLDKLNTDGLVAGLDTPNGWQRDMAMHVLAQRGDRSAAKGLERLTASPRAETRLQALCALDLLQGLSPAVVVRALKDPHPGVRRHGVRLTEQLLASHGDLGEALVKLVRDENAQVRLQLAYSLGAWRDARSGQALAELAVRHAADPYLVAAVLSSVKPENVAAFAGTVMDPKTKTSAALRQSSLGLVAAMGDGVLQTVVPAINRIEDLGSVLPALHRRGKTLAAVVGPDDAPRLAAMLEKARHIAGRAEAPLSDRLAAVTTFGWDKSFYARDQLVLAGLLGPQTPDALQSAAVMAFGRMDDAAPAEMLTRS